MPEHLERIAKRVRDVKRSKFEVDAQDYFCNFKGVELSFLRDWGTGKALVMLTEEALLLDAKAGTMPESLINK